MIKPEDIPARFAYTNCIHVATGSIKDISEHIAAILNAAIEAGIVSPPCHCVRWDGELQTHDKSCTSTGLIQPRVFAGKPFSHDTEHYRGQTE